MGPGGANYYDSGFDLIIDVGNDFRQLVPELGNLAVSFVWPVNLDVGNSVLDGHIKTLKIHGRYSCSWFTSNSRKMEHPTLCEEILHSKPVSMDICSDSNSRYQTQLVP